MWIFLIIGGVLLFGVFVGFFFFLIKKKCYEALQHKPFSYGSHTLKQEPQRIAEDFLEHCRKERTAWQLYY